jgi:hypothetical protein
VLTDTLGRRFIFFVNLPHRGGGVRGRPGRADCVGTLLITVALTALMFALIRGNAMAVTSLASMAHRTATSTWLVLLSGLVLAGIGLGITSTGLASAALSAVEPACAGMAAGLTNTLRHPGPAGPQRRRDSRRPRQQPQRRPPRRGGVRPARRGCRFRVRT